MNKKLLLIFLFIMFFLTIDVHAQKLKKIENTEFNICIPVRVDDEYSIIRYFVEDDVLYILESKKRKNFNKDTYSFANTLRKFDLTKDFESQELKLSKISEPLKELSVFNSYILITTTQGLYIIDKRTLKFIGIFKKIIAKKDIDNPCFLQYPDFSLIIDKNGLLFFFYLPEKKPGNWEKRIWALNNILVFDKKSSSDKYPPTMKDGKIYYFGNIDWFPIKGDPCKELLIYDIYSKRESNTGIVVPYQFDRLFLSGNFLFCQSYDEVYCYEISNLQIIWKQDFSFFNKMISNDKEAITAKSNLQDIFFNDFIVDNKGSIIFNNGFSLMCLERNTGKIPWTYIPSDVKKKLKNQEKIATSYNRSYYINSFADNLKTRLLLFGNTIIDCSNGKPLMKVDLKKIEAIRTSKNKLFIFSINSKTRKLQVTIYLRVS